MYTFISQERFTIRGPATGGFTTTTTQGKNAWLELPDYQDAVAWLTVSEMTVTGSLQIGYQTAPTADDGLFAMMSGPVNAVPFTPSLGVTVTPLVKELVNAPLGRWFRWQLLVSSTSVWDITFRLYVSANCLGAKGGWQDTRGIRTPSPSEEPS